MNRLYAGGIEFMNPVTELCMPKSLTLYSSPENQKDKLINKNIKSTSYFNTVDRLLRYRI